MIRIDPVLRIVTVERPTLWLPTCSQVARGVLKIAAYLLTGWLIYSAGQHSMASVALDARSDADWCAGMLSETLHAGERSAALLAQRSIAQRWVLASRGIEYVASNDED